MPFNLLLLPLAGGYFFLVFCNLTKHYHHRIDRQKLIFNSVLAGTGLLALSFFIIFLLNKLPEYWMQWLKQFLPMHLPYTGTAITSFLLGILLAVFINLIISNEKANRRAIDRMGTNFEKLIKNAIETASLILVTLENGKVYVGWPLDMPKPSVSSEISIMPVFSGYRDDEQNVHFTTEYLDVYTEIQEQANSGEEIDIQYEFLLIIPISRIVSTSAFYIEIYERFASERLAKRSQPKKRNKKY